MKILSQTEISIVIGGNLTEVGTPPPPAIFKILGIEPIEDVVKSH